MLKQIMQGQSDRLENQREFTDRNGAAELKALIEAYWRARGFDVQVMLVEGPFSQALRTSRVDVRSDLVNGLPRFARARARLS